MPRGVLLLRLEGPLQSWGERAQWDVRDSASEPTKSAIIGLLGAALGLRRGAPELADLDAKLKFGVRVDEPGLRVVDFHTVQGVLPSADGGTKGSMGNPYTIVSQRTYLQDAQFLVGLEGELSQLERCRAALERPKWPCYLGRKSCPPTRPVFDGIVEGELCEVLKSHQPRPESGFALVWQSERGNYRRRDRLTGRPSREHEENRYQRDWIDSKEAFHAS